jgi:hypothetical protein
MGLLMRANLVDTLTDRASSRVSRRGSLWLLGLAPLVAAVARESPTEAKKHSQDGQREKKKRKKPRGATPPPVDRCRTQVAECEGSVALLCAASLDPQECRQRLNPCCIPLGECNATEFFTCLDYSTPTT